MGENNSTLGINIRNARIRLGKTLVEVANFVGVSKQTIQRYETGVISNIPSDKIELIAQALNTTPQELMGWDDEQHYYIDDDAREMAEFLHKNPDYKVLFDASRNVKKEDIEFVKQMLDKFKGND